MVSLHQSLLLESLLVRRYWETRRRLLAAGEAEAVILPAPEVVEGRTKEVGEVELAVMTARQTRAAAVLGRLAEREPMTCWRMVCERWGAGAASSLSEEAGPLMKPTRMGVEPRWQPSS